MSQIQPSQSSQNHIKTAHVNKKKAEFEKKIRKFIESDSPHQSIQQNRNTNEYSFESDILHSQLQNNPIDSDKPMKVA